MAVRFNDQCAHTQIVFWFTKRSSRSLVYIRWAVGFIACPSLHHYALDALMLASTLILLAIASLVGATPPDTTSHSSFLDTPTLTTGDVYVEKDAAKMDPVQRRQTNSKEVLRRATKRRTAPRAYMSAS